MKKLVVLFTVLFLAAFIVLPGTTDGKYNLSKPTVADGSPLPPFPPNPSGATLLADGSPLPPFPPNPSGTSRVNATDMLVADGSPLPPFPPNPSATSSGLLA